MSTPPDPFFTHGSNADAFFGGRILSYKSRSVTSSIERDKADAGTFKKKVKRYTVGPGDHTITLEGWVDFDEGKEAADKLFSQYMSSATDEAFSVFASGAEVGRPGLSTHSLVTKHDITSDIGATVGFSVEASPGPKGTVDRLISMAYVQEVSSAGNSQTFDFGAASTKTGKFTVHAYTTGGTLTVKLQDSADGSTWADVATLTFTGGSSGSPNYSGQRVETPSNLRRYVRATWSGAGTINLAGVGR
ncbi:hypothetical protein GCM10010423_65150 [Streptomyces levis]|uniref:Uncharacterized protein n=1 Tax=Streptomyces levis TaxID=285566 RepID=A0ABN3P2H3_9ACTN